VGALALERPKRRQIVGQHLGQDEGRHQIGRLTVSSCEFCCRRFRRAALPAHASEGGTATGGRRPEQMPPAQT
jgi:hypothetical protein